MAFRFERKIAKHHRKRVDNFMSGDYSTQIIYKKRFKKDKNKGPQKIYTGRNSGVVINRFSFRCFAGSKKINQL